MQSLSNKKAEVLKEMEKLKPDAVVFTETKLKGKGQEIVGEYLHFWSGVNKSERARAGVSLLIRKEHKDKVKFFDLISERIIRVDLYILGRKISIIGVYSPNNNMKPEIKDSFEEELRSVLEAVKNRDDVILLGDMNARVGKERGNAIVGCCGEEVWDDNGRRLRDVCEEFELKIHNTFFTHKAIHQYTWNKPGFQSSVLDYCISKQKSSLKVEDVRVLRSVECGSDHFFLYAKVLAPWRRRGRVNLEEPKVSSLETEMRKYNLALLGDDSIKDLYRRRLEGKLNVSTGTSAAEKYNHLKDCVHQAAFEALGVLEREPNKPWFDSDCAALVDEKKTAFKKWLSSRCAADWSAYKALNVKVKKEVSKGKNKAWEECCRRIDNTLGYNKVKESWRVLKTLKTPIKGNCVPLVKDSEWVAHYRSLLTETRPGYSDPIYTQVTDTLPVVSVTREEVAAALTKAKNGKAPGPGGITMELLKAGGEKTLLVLTDVVNRVLAGEELPEDLKVGYLSSVYKKGDRRKCGNYRGICVQSAVSRIVGRLVRDKLEREYRTPEEQCGFTAGKSCVDNIFVLRQLIEKRAEKKKELHLAFIDLEQAYDSVPRRELLAGLREAGISSELIAAIHHLYKDDVYRVKCGSRLSEPFRASKGLKQGCCMSPTLFKIYLEQAVKVWSTRWRSRGVDIEGEMLFSLYFADDQVVISTKRDNLEHMLRDLNEEYRKKGLKINFNKTEYMAVGSPDAGDITVGDDVCRRVSDFKYLGSLLNELGTSDMDVKRRAGQARNVTRMLHSVLWNNTVSVVNKRRIFCSFVESVLTYGSETWALNQSLLSKVQTVEMDFWRRCLKVTRLDRLRNEDIRKKMGVTESVSERIGKRRLQWYGHCQRMEDSRWPKRILEWEQPGRRGRGRPRTSWMRGVEEEMAGRGLREGDWMDRVLWKNALT